MNERFGARSQEYSLLSELVEVVSLATIEDGTFLLKGCKTHRAPWTFPSVSGTATGIGGGGGRGVVRW